MALWDEGWWNEQGMVPVGDYGGGGGGWDGGAYDYGGGPTFSVTGYGIADPPDLGFDFSSWGVPNLWDYPDAPLWNIGGLAEWDPLSDYVGGPACNCGAVVPSGAPGGGGSSRPGGSTGGAPGGGGGGTPQQRPPQTAPAKTPPWFLLAAIALLVYATKKKG